MRAVSEIESIIKNTKDGELSEVLKSIKADERSSVKKLVLRAEKRYDKYLKELKRLEGLWAFEDELFTEGKKYIAGVDEVGRGPLAGPVVTAAVILKPHSVILGLNDSKKLSEKKREELYDIINKEALAVCITMEDNGVIDDINILQATLKSMRRSVLGLEISPDFVLADAVTIPDLPMGQKGIIKGDAKSASIAAASIVAKVWRDRLMVSYAEKYPVYGFEKNKGYGTAEHIEAIKKYGLCPIHRRSFTGGFV